MEDTLWVATLAGKGVVAATTPKGVASKLVKGENGVHSGEGWGKTGYPTRPTDNPTSAPT